MSKEDPYFTLPLAHLRQCASPVDTLETAVSVGIVNAGLGVEKVRGPLAFISLLEQAQAEAEAVTQGLPHLSPTPSELAKLEDANGELIAAKEGLHLWEAAMVGWKLLGVAGGDRFENVQLWLKYHRPGEVFFRIKADWLWQALATARRDEGEDEGYIEHPISWREFRLLAGLLAARTNSHDFTFCSWETLQALACGYHNKAALKYRERNELPDHCQPLSRQMIRQGTQTLEALNFYARCRYARGKAGGLMAYSFRHPRREDLYAAIQQWDASNHAFQSKTASLRAADLLAFTQSQPTDNQALTN